MAYSYSEHPNVVVGQTLTLGFLYEPTSTVRVLVDGVLVPESLYFWPTDNEITTKTGFPIGAVTRVERFTPIDEYNAQNGTSVYDFEGVNLNFQQLLYALQESRDNEDSRQQQIDNIESTASALAAGLELVDQAVLDVAALAQAASDSAEAAETFNPANFYTKLEANDRYYTQSQVYTRDEVDLQLGSRLAKDASNVGDEAAQESFRLAIGAISDVELENAVRGDQDQSSKSDEWLRQVWDNTRQGCVKVAGGEVNTAVTSLDIPLVGGFRIYEVHLSIRPTTDATEAFLRFSSDEGVTFDTGSTEYRFRRSVHDNAGAISGTGQSSAGNIQLTGNYLGNGSSQGAAIRLYLADALTPSKHTKVNYFSEIHRGNNDLIGVFGGGRANVLKATNAIRIYLSSGTISEASYEVYGYD